MAEGNGFVAEEQGSWWTWLTGAGDDYYEYTISAVGDVYDAVTGELIGVYDEATDAVWYGGEIVFEGVSEVYEDVKEGAGSLTDTINRGLDVGDKALNVSSVVLLGGAALVAYFIFRPWLK